MPRATRDPWTDALAHLSASDARLADLIERVGPCLLRPRKDRFGVLVRAIVGQQISTRAAETIAGRLLEKTGAPYRHDAILALSDDELRGCGLSSQKVKYVRALSEHVRDGKVRLQRMHRMDDEEIIKALTQVPGIGRWTAEMFLIFSLNRPDVLPVSDLGIRAGLRDHHDLADLPAPRRCVELAEPWRPYRSVAMWYLWKSLALPKSAA